MVSSLIASSVRSFANLAGSDVIPDSTIQQFIDLAYLIRTEDLAESSASAERLDAIELNLAAHFAILSLEHGGFTEQRVGNSYERYQMLSNQLTGLTATRFGQTALALDDTGLLAKLTSPRKALFRVI